MMASNDEAWNAARQAFSIFALVESILVNLFPLDLEGEDLYQRAQNMRAFFRFRRRNPAFRDAIVSSKAIRTATYQRWPHDTDNGQEIQQGTSAGDEWSVEDMEEHLNPIIIYLDKLIVGVRIWLEITKPRHSRLGEISVEVSTSRWEEDDGRD